MKKYYLGYNTSICTVPIESNEIKTNLLGLIDYTTQFDTVEELIESLSNITSIYSYDDTYFYYEAEGTKKNRIFRPLTNKIYLSKHKHYFNRDYLKQYLMDEMQNKELFSHLYAHYIEVYALEFIIKLLTSTNSLIKTLYGLKSMRLSKEYKTYLNNLINNNVLSESDKIVDLIAKIKLMHKKYHDNDVIEVFKYFKSVIQNNYPEYKGRTLLNRVNELNDISRSIADKEFDTAFYAMFEPALERTLTSIINIYLPQKDDFVMEGGKRKVNGTNLCDLAFFIRDYQEEDYLYKLQKEADDLAKARIDEIDPETTLGGLDYVDTDLEFYSLDEIQKITGDVPKILKRSE